MPSEFLGIVHVTFVDAEFVIFVGIAFVSVANTLSVAFIISLHTLTKVSEILFKYLPFSPIHVPDLNYNLSCKYNAFYTRFIIPFLILTTCCTIKFAFAIT